MRAWRSQAFDRQMAMALHLKIGLALNNDYIFNRK
jgi:hypothetical protein